MPLQSEALIRTSNVRTHVGYPNAFSKATPTISGYFRRRAVQMADIECFRARSTCCIAAEDTGYFYGQGRLCNKSESNCQTQPLGTTSLPQEMETEQRLTVVRILALATYAVSSSSLADP